MGYEEKKGFPTWIIVVAVLAGVSVLAVMGIAVVAAIAIPSLLRSRIAANEASAVGTLRSLVTAESTWRQTDADRNTVADYWTADVSGFYRVERLPDGSGLPLAALDVAVAVADDDKVGEGAAIPGGSVPGAPESRTAALLSLSRTAPKTGFFFRAVRQDERAQPYATDPDGDGNAWSNAGQFAFQARPETYDTTGLNTFIVNESGVIYGMDSGNNAPANAEAWPDANPTRKGWRVVQ